MTEMMTQAVTISRQMGSGAHCIGYLVAKELGFKYVNREILDEAAKRIHTDVSFLKHYDETSVGILESIARGFFFGAPETDAIPPLRRPIYNRDLYNLEGKIMNEIVDRHSAVIMGHGGFFALRERSRVIRVFIYAPLEFRIERIMKTQNMKDVGKARSIVEESDRRRGKFIRAIAGASWTDVRNYDLCLDSSFVDSSTCVGIIADLARRGEPLAPGKTDTLVPP